MNESDPELCPLCGCPKSDGAHGVFRPVESKDGRFECEIVICEPILVCDNPRYCVEIDGIVNG